jgi:hypothetical protein
MGQDVVTRFSIVDGLVMMRANICPELFESSNPLREELLERLLRPKLDKVGLDGDKSRELREGIKKK